jgi:hypothetical protein
VAGLSNKCAKRCCRGAALIGVQESKPFGIIRTCCINLHHMSWRPDQLCVKNVENIENIENSLRDARGAHKPHRVQGSWLSSSNSLEPPLLHITPIILIYLAPSCRSPQRLPS